MKIAYKHLVQCIKENPTIDEISKNLFQLGHEHEIENKIFHMEFTPNRGDCLSVDGILRDLAVFYTINSNRTLYEGEIEEFSMDFENLQPDICPQISFLKLEIKESPSKYNGLLEDYFSDLNINNNNFFTDISNYISYETGQPTHCYDEEKINDKLILEEIENSEEFKTLLGTKILLSQKDAVFTLKNKVISLAGVVGGSSTACSANTRSVLIECAFFKPEAIIGKSVKYDIQSDAAHKFERGVDPDCHERVLRRFVKIISDHVEVKKIKLFVNSHHENKKNVIPLDTKKINQIIGINLTQEEYTKHLLKLGFIIEDNFIKVPFFRHDVRTQNDLAEEVARVIGYDNIEKACLKIPKNKNHNNKDHENKVKSFLIDNGFYEVINSPFVSHSSERSIKVDNPLDSNREFLRTNIIDSLTDNLIFNERRQKDSIKLFEISDVYEVDNGIQSKRMLALIASGRVGLNYQEFSQKISQDYLSSIFRTLLPEDGFDFKILSRDGLNTKIKYPIITLEVDIDSLSPDFLKYNEASSPPKNFIQYNKISEQPSSYRDISFSIKHPDKIEELQNLIFNFSNELIKDVFIFDYFNNTKKNEIKVGFRFIFQSRNTTLTDNQVDIVLNDIMTNCINIDSVKIPGFNNELN